MYDDVESREEFEDFPRHGVALGQEDGAGGEAQGLLVPGEEGIRRSETIDRNVQSKSLCNNKTLSSFHQESLKAIFALSLLFTDCVLGD